MFARAIEIMDRHPLVFSPGTPVREVRIALSSKRLDGVCVVENGELVGVVTAMDLVFQERGVPTRGRFNSPHTRRVLEKVTGQLVGDIMSDAPVTVAPAAELVDLAEVMVDNHYTILPVLNEGKLVGVVDKWAILQAASGEGVSDEPTHG